MSLLRKSLLRSTLTTTPAARLLPRAFTSAHLCRSTIRAMSSASAIPSNMKAINIKGDKGPASALFMDQIETPKPKDGQVLVKIKAFGLNRMDLLQREGKYPLPPQAGPILGVEFSGTVVQAESGPDARWKEGDEVFGLAYGGAYAEYIAVSAKMCIRKPDHLSHLECAAIPENFLTAFQALFLVGNMKQGDSVLVHAGAGGVGVAANQLARAFGAKNVFTTAGSDEKLKFLETLPAGSTKGINYRTEDFSEVIKAETEGKGVDVILDFIGKDYFEKNIASLGVEGRLVFLAFMSGPKVDSVNLGPILYKRLQILGTTLRARNEAYQGHLLNRFETEALPMIKPGGVEVRIHEVFDWKDVQASHEMMEANKNSGKIVLEIRD